MADPTKTGDEYFGGTPTRGYAPKPVQREEEVPYREDFSGSNPGLKALDQQQKLENRYRLVGEQRGRSYSGANRGRYVAHYGKFLPGYDLNRRADEIAEQAAGLRKPFDPKDPEILKAVTTARENGFVIDDQELSLINTAGEVDIASDAYINAMRNGDEQGAINILLTAAEKNPSYASLIPAVAEQKLLSTVGDLATDGGWLDDALNVAGSVLGTALAPLEWANEQVQHLFRAGSPSAAAQANEISGPLRVPIVSTWGLTAKGQWNEQVLNGIRESDVYPPEAVDLAVEISTYLTEGGDPTNVMPYFMQKYGTDPVRGPFLESLIYKDADELDYSAEELMNQVESANNGSLGQVALTGLVGTGYQSFKGSQAYNNAADTITAVGMLAADPTNIAFGAGRIINASKYALGKLAPSADGAASLTQALKSKKVLGVETNKGRRYIDGLASDLNKLDAIEDPSKKAAMALQIEKRYRELPPDVIQSIAKGTANGERTGGSIVKYLGEQNDQWLVTTGKLADEAVTAGVGAISDRLALAGLADLLDEKQLRKFLETGELPKDVRTLIDSSVVNPQVTSTLETGANLVDDKIARGLAENQPLVNRLAGGADWRHARRTPMMPRRTILGDMRRVMVNGIMINSLPSGKVAKSVDSFLAGVAKQSDPRIAAFLDTPEGAKAFADEFKSSWLKRPLTTTNPGKFYIRDARDTQSFYKFVRLYFSDDAATQLAAVWRNATPGERRQLAAGTVRSAAIARGVKLKDEEIYKKIDDLATGSRSGEMYSVTTNGVRPSDEAARAEQINLQQAKLKQAEVKAKSAEKAQARAEEAATKAANADREITELENKLSALMSPTGSGTFVQDKAKSVAKLRKQISAKKAEKKRFESQIKKNEAAAADLSNDAQRLGQEAGVLRDRTPEEIADETKSWSASRRDGREHAVHRYQVADYVAVPTVGELEAIGRYQNSALGKIVHPGMQGVTDLWSLGTLYGFRFAQRSAIEDIAGYILTGGDLGSLRRGKSVSGGIRAAGPTIKIVVKDSAKGKDVLGPDDFDVVMKSRLGMIVNPKGRLTQSGLLGKKIQGNNLAAHWGAVARTLEPERIKKATIAFKNGDQRPMAELVFEALSKQKLTGLDDEDLRIIRSFVGSSHGMRMLDDIGEGAWQINSGTAPNPRRGFTNQYDDVVEAQMSPVAIAGDFKKLGLSAENNRVAYAAAAWWRQLAATMDEDGMIGKLAVQNLTDIPEAKRVVAAEIRRDMALPLDDPKRVGYADDFTMLAGGGDNVQDFADRYVENVFQHFQKQDGTLNRELRSKFIVASDDGTTTTVRFTDPNGRQRVKVEDLRAMDPADKPQYVLGREMRDGIPMPSSERPFFTDRAWEWMGEQYSRMAREPVFLANYLSARRALSGKPTRTQARFNRREIPVKRVETDSFEDGLAKAIAGGKNPNAIQKKMAGYLSDRLAADHAATMTLAYVDNPGNRSMLAWKVRNVARYYRATEDFYRRAGRLARNYPDAYWKIALTYQAVTDTGFVFTDDNGDAYFAYPGNQLLQRSLAFTGTLATKGDLGLAWSAWQQEPTHTATGRLKNLAPSTDPTQLIPTMTGGVMTIPMVAVFNAFPSLQGLKTLTLGDYSNAGQTGSFLGELAEALVPASLKRAMRIVDPDTLDSSLASTAAGVDAIMIANGEYDEAFGEDPMTLEKLKKTDIFARRQQMALAGTIVKTIGGWAVPASPQLMEDNSTQWAKDHGVDNVKDFFRDYVDFLSTVPSDEDPDKMAYPDPYAEALRRMAEMGVSEDGVRHFDLTPFTVSATKNNPEKLLSMTGAQPYKETYDWARSPEAQALADKFPNTYMFLAPQTGEFDWTAWALLTGVLGTKIPKSGDERVIEMMAMRGDREDTFVTEMYDTEINNLNPAGLSLNQIEDEATKDKIRALREAKQAEKDRIKKENPYWAVKSDDYTWQKQDRVIVLDETRDMIDYLKQGDKPLSEDAFLIDLAIQAFDNRNNSRSTLGNSKADMAEKDAIDEQLAQIWAGYSENPVAQNFIKRVLEPMI